MPLAIVVLIVVAVGSLAVAASAYLGERSRRELVARTAGRPAHGDLAGYAAAIPLRDRAAGTLTRLAGRVRSRGAADQKIEQALVQAGYDGALAPLAYAVVRVGASAGLALAALVLAPKERLPVFAGCVLFATAVGFLLPSWYVGYAVRQRQTKIRRSLPDALDLLVVCIEAGTSLDAALLRVAKDIGGAHPELARELLVLNRRTNAGMPRQDALRGLWERTGVVEIRALVSHILQGEKWGTSSGRVLRVYAETLRRQRRQAAERKAATAPVKMLLPLGLFIFPAILLVILGPVIMTVAKMFQQQ